MTEREICNKYLSNGKYNPGKSEIIRQQRKDELNKVKIVDTKTFLQKIFSVQPETNLDLSRR